MSFIAKLPDWGLIHASGPDAQAFLHGQLTNDLLHLAPDAAQWSGYCSAKGRMLAGFLVWRDGGDGFYLATDRDLLPGLVKRLKMFVLRAKTVIEDCSEQYAALGTYGADNAAALPAMGVRRVDAGTVETAPDATAAPASPSVAPSVAPTVAPSVVPPTAQAWHIALPAVDGVPRTLTYTRTGTAADAPAAAASALPPATAAEWTRLMVLAGEAWITQATQEVFVPQMINFDALDGINFKKGCYPGQEIVARAHYRGAVKRRMYRATVDAPAKAGDVLYASDLNGQESGIIALAAPVAPAAPAAPAASQPGLGGLTGQTTTASEVLAVIQIQSHANAEVRLGAPNGPLLRFAPLPYALPEAV